MKNSGECLFDFPDIGRHENHCGRKVTKFVEKYLVEAMLTAENRLQPEMPMKLSNFHTIGLVKF